MNVRPHELRAFFSCLAWRAIPSLHAWEEEMATHSSILAWRIPRTGEPGRLPSMGSHSPRILAWRIPMDRGAWWATVRGVAKSQTPLPFGERTRDCSPGHAGKEGPQLARMGASQGFPRAAAPVGVFSPALQADALPSEPPGKPTLLVWPQISSYYLAVPCLLPK